MENLSRKVMKSYNGFAPKRHPCAWLFVVVMVWMALLSACAAAPVNTLTPSSITDTPGEVTQAPTEASKEPVPCTAGEPGNYTCEGLSGRMITLSNVPSNVIPFMTPISAEYEAFLRGPDAKKESTECIFMIAGDLTFYEDDKPVESFASPVTITYKLFELDQDQQGFSDCQETLIKQGFVQKAEEVDYFPVYFDKDVWKPFKAENVSLDNGTVTIQFKSWGDQPIGGGTRP